MALPKYCYQCEYLNNRKVKATAFEANSRHYGLCKLHKKLEGSAYERIKYGKKRWERRAIAIIKSHNEGRGLSSVPRVRRVGYKPSFLANAKLHNALDRLVASGKIRYRKSLSNKTYHLSGYWIVK